MSILQQIAAAAGVDMEEARRRTAGPEGPRASSATIEEIRAREEAARVERAGALPAPPAIAEGTARRLIGERESARDRFKTAFRSRRNVEEASAALKAASDAVMAYGAACRKAAGVALRVRNTPNTFSGGGDNGGNHLVAEERFVSGRLVRASGDVLCQPKREFFDLVPPYVDAPSCARCVEAAERLALRNGK